ncbi:DNA primase large subunit-like [Ornithodoros turicata]|uniref:DNA primase large subunit-like n=1 Tax=Ornithodoros turicata TaxID=34597 RepID=UPI003139904D
MQFSGSRRKRHVDAGPTLDKVHGGTVLQFYCSPPVEQMSLEEVEELAMERLKVLKVFEDAGVKFSRSSQDYASAIKEELRKQKLKSYIETAPSLRSRDNTSHFILQLIFCRSHELRQWFINQEVELFRFRFQNETASNTKAFLQAICPEYQPISAEQKASLMQHLLDTLSDGSDMDTIYKVPFTEALELVSERAVYLHAGYAYLPRGGLLSVTAARFRDHLSRMLANTVRRLPGLQEDERLRQLSSAIERARGGGGFRLGSAAGVTADMIDQLCKESFPLCMKAMHEVLRKNHHLRHGGRLQYGLFLKGIGLSLEEALRFWREEFAQHVGADNFDKKYSYNVRHSYGREGRRANYTPFGCTSIITAAIPGPTDCHGCPFVHWSRPQLKAKLQSEGVTGHNLQEVMQQVESGHYQLACTTVFSVTHGGQNPEAMVISHPNEYFERSRQARDNKCSESNRKKEDMDFADDLDDACLQALQDAEVPES